MAFCRNVQIKNGQIFMWNKRNEQKIEWVNILIHTFWIELNSVWFATDAAAADFKRPNKYQMKLG